MVRRGALREAARRPVVEVIGPHPQRLAEVAQSLRQPAVAGCGPVPLRNVPLPPLPQSVRLAGALSQSSQFVNVPSVRAVHVSSAAIGVPLPPFPQSAPLRSRSSRAQERQRVAPRTARFEGGARVRCVNLEPIRLYDEAQGHAHDNDYVAEGDGMLSC
jgi:hypothetical protein